MNIYITFDYEVYLGTETGTVEHCMIIPTDKLREVSHKYNMYYTFFVDVLFILKMKEYIEYVPSLECDYYKIVDQLKSLSNEGHDLQLHIHPQWYYSSYDVKKTAWNLDFDHYKISDCSLCDVEIMFYKSCEFLHDITGKNPIAYRAGGYSFPKDKKLLMVLSKHNLKKDSSVLMLEKSNTRFQSYNYTKINKFETYFFDDDINIPRENGFFKEYPISAIIIPHIYRFFVNKYLFLSCKNELKIFGDGKGIGCKLSNEERYQKSTFNKLTNKIAMRASLDFTNSYWLDMIKRNVKKNNQHLLVIIGHPKMLTMYSLKKLDSFLSNLGKDDKVKIFSE